MDSTGSDTGATQAPEPTGAAAETVSAVSRAQEMRASLGARRDVEAMLAEASELRRTAAADADSIVEEAQQISVALLDESKQHAEQTAGEARERADGILARARAEATELTARAEAEAEAVRLDSETRADEHREKIRAEVHEQRRRELVAIRQQSDSLIGDAESAMKTLGANLESAMMSVAQVLENLGDLRTSSVDALPEPTDDDATRFASGVTAPAESVFASPAEADVVDQEAGVAEPAVASVAPVDEAPSPNYASVPPPAVAAQAPAFSPDDTETRVPHAEVPEPSVASFAEPAVAEMPRAEMPRAEMPRAEVPEPSVASFAEPAVAEVHAAEVPRSPDLDTREVAAVPASQAPEPTRLDAGSSSIFAVAREELTSDADRVRHDERSAGSARAAGFRGGRRDDGPAHKPADSSDSTEDTDVREETLEVMPASEQRPRESEAGSRPLGWLFRSAQ